MAMKEEKEEEDEKERGGRGRGVEVEEEEEECRSFNERGGGERRGRVAGVHSGPAQCHGCQRPQRVP